MERKEVYHLALTQERIEGARYAFLPGDPGRVSHIASAFDPAAREVAAKREYRSWLGQMAGTPVLVASTGIGGPSTSIAVEELASIGVRLFLRVGTTGAIQPQIEVGDVIVTTGSVRLDGASNHYAPLEYPAVSDYGIVNALVASARTHSVRCHVGITASSATFYPGQERTDSYAGHVVADLRGSLEEWKRLGVLNYEMESSTLFVVCSALGLRAGCVCGVIGDRTQGEAVNSSGVQPAVQKTIQVAVDAMEMLITQDRALVNDD